MGIEEYWSIKHGVNPFTKQPITLQGLDRARLCAFADDARQITLRPRSSKRGEKVLHGSRYGGQVLLPRKARWPRGPSGPLSFIGQLDFAQLSAAHGIELGLPPDGTLALFFDLENQPWGLSKREAKLRGLQDAEKRGVDVVGIAKDANLWKLLWQIDTDDSLFTWGDCGRLYLLIRADDLKALRFEHVWCVLQCH